MLLFSRLEVNPIDKVDNILQDTLHVDSASAFVDKLMTFLIDAGERILIALLILVIGRFIISIIKKIFKKFLSRRDLDQGVKTFLTSMVNITLLVLLLISVIGTLGVNITSFAALIASAGVAIGMGLSGNLQNIAGGIIILIAKPYRVGDSVECQGVTGTVNEILIFHTIIRTGDNRVVYIPNGSLSSGVIINNNQLNKRRLEWSFGVEYDVDYEMVEKTLREIVDADSRILKDPEPYFALKELADNSVNCLVRGWVVAGDYWDVYFDLNKKVYEVFNKKGIGFPFPQLTVHKADK